MTSSSRTPVDLVYSDFFYKLFLMPLVDCGLLRSLAYACMINNTWQAHSCLVVEAGCATLMKRRLWSLFFAFSLCEVSSKCTKFWSLTNVWPYLIGGSIFELESYKLCLRKYFTLWCQVWPKPGTMVCLLYYKLLFNNEQNVFIRCSICEPAGNGSCSISSWSWFWIASIGP